MLKFKQNFYPGLWKITYSRDQYFEKKTERCYMLNNVKKRAESLEI